MEWIGIAILAGLTAWILFAAKSAKKHKGGCSGCCSDCRGCSCKETDTCNKKPS